MLSLYQYHKTLTEITNQYHKVIQYDLSKQNNMHSSIFHRMFEVCLMVSAFFAILFHVSVGL